MCEHWKCYFVIIHFNTWSLGFHWNNLFIMVICFNRELLSPHNWLSKADLRDLNIRKLGSALSEALISFLGRVLRTRWFLRFFSPLILDETFYVCLAPPPAPLEWSWPWLSTWGLLGMPAPLILGRTITSSFATTIPPWSDHLASLFSFFLKLYFEENHPVHYCYKSALWLYHTTNTRGTKL